MLRHNIDVSDGLYNGARGVVVKIEWDTPHDQSSSTDTILECTQPPPV